MLIKMRRFGGKWVLAIFSLFIMGSFGFWGIGDVVRGIFTRSINAVAFVGDSEISALEFEREYRQIRAVFGTGIDREQARQMGLFDRALDLQVARTLYDLESQRLGLAIPDETVAQVIQQTPEFRNPFGDFDRNIFASALAAQGITEQEYIAMVRDDMRRNQLVGSITGPLSVPDTLLDTIYRYREERRTAEYFIVPTASIADIEEPDEATLAAFHRDNAHLFTAPEYRAITYIHITPSELAEEIAVPEETVEAEYLDRQSEFRRPERRALQQIVLPDKDSAERAMTDIAGGTPMAVAGGVDETEIELGFNTRADLALLSPELADAVFSLGVDQISQPIQSPLGWHVFRVTAIEKESVRPFAEVRDALARDIAMREAIDALYDLSNRLDDALAGGATLEDAASALTLRLERIDAIDARGNSPAGTTVEGLPAADDFLATAFSAVSGETSLLGEADDGSLYVLRVDDVVPPALRPLDEVRDEVLAAWRDSQRITIAAARAAEAAGRVNRGEAIESVAAEFGQAAQSSEPLRRDGEGGGAAMSPLLVANLFTLDVGEAAAGASGDGQGHVVAQLVDVTRPSPKDDDATVARERERLRNSLEIDLANQYRANLEARFPVRVNQGALEALY